MGGCWQQSSALLLPVALLEVVLGGRMGPPWCQGSLCNISSMAPAPAVAPSCGFLLPGAVASKGVQRRLPLPAHAGEFPVPGWLGSTRGSQGHLQPPCTQPEDLPSGRAVGPSSESCEGPVCHAYPSTTTGGRVLLPLGLPTFTGGRVACWCQTVPEAPIAPYLAAAASPQGKSQVGCVGMPQPPMAACPWGCQEPGQQLCLSPCSCDPPACPQVTAQPKQLMRPMVLTWMAVPKKPACKGLLVPACVPRAAVGPGQSFPGDGGGCSGTSSVRRGKG